MSWESAANRIYSNRRTYDSLQNDRGDVEARNAAQPWLEGANALDLENLTVFSNALGTMRANKIAAYNTQQRLTKLRTPSKFRQLTDEELKTHYKGNRLQFKNAKEGYNRTSIALDKGVPYETARLVNGEEGNLASHLALVKHTNTTLQNFEGFFKNFRKSGIPLVYTEGPLKGKIVDVSSNELSPIEFADLLHTASHEYFKSNRFFGDDGKGGPDDKFLTNQKFDEKLNAIELGLHKDYVQQQNELAKFRTETKVLDIIEQSSDAHIADKTDGEDLDIDLLLTMLQTIDGKAGKEKTLGEAWDYLYNRVTILAQNGQIQDATYLANQLEKHPRSGTARIEEARATIDKNSSKAADAREGEVKTNRELILNGLLRKTLTKDEAAALNGIVDKNYNPTGVKFNVESIVGQASVAQLGDIATIKRDLITAANSVENFRLINPDSDEARNYPEEVQELIEKLWIQGNTFASINNTENKPIKDRYIENFTATIVQAWPQFYKGVESAAKTNKMVDAAKAHFLELTKNAIGPDVDAVKAMELANAIVEANLKGVIANDAESAKKNRYYITGNAPYDATSIGKRLIVGDFLSTNIGKLGDIESLKKADGYDNFVASFNAMPDGEIQALINYAQGDFAKVSELSPSMELLYRRTGGKKLPWNKLLSVNSKEIANTNRQLWAQTILAASGTDIKSSNSKFESSVAKIQKICTENPELEDAGKLFLKKLMLWQQDPRSAVKAHDLIQHAQKCGADTELLQNLK